MGRIELCGGPGVGKTTCATAISDKWVIPLVRELFENVPYWHKFHDNPAGYALEKDLSFFIPYGDQLRAAPNESYVCDFALFQTVAYSEAAQDAADSAAVAAVYERIIARRGRPRLVVRLRCDLQTQVARIRERGRAPELGLSAEYLRRLDDAIDRQLCTLELSVATVNLDTSRLTPRGLIYDEALKVAIERCLR